MGSTGLTAEAITEWVGERTLAEDGAVLTAEEEAFVAALRASGATLAHPLSAADLAAFRLALPQMIRAALPTSPAGPELGDAILAAEAERGTFIDPENNWFTQNIVRFGGGFDMEQLTAQASLAAGAS